MLCAVRRYTVLNRLHEVTWYRRQPKKWVVVIGLLLADQLVVKKFSTLFDARCNHEVYETNVNAHGLTCDGEEVWSSGL